MTAEDRARYWHRRARDAERCLEFEKEHNEQTRRWAQEAFTEQRRITDLLIATLKERDES